ncbi:hypothetical protein C4B68_24305 [Streptomyces dengpaensis]|uniref:Uncharacterized protein n=1 Tax=Streptomyces dengpaensis TaxID=2049881 RepID=A0ABM6T2Q8_9ACTN|nr:hypothetical protein C4B68_24305 [Streptomyces dengpaensis]PIB06145.1 hypothetical protein B1C81_26025 [Streptomyces sp. HG99]
MPPAADLSFPQFQGWACVFCSASFMHGRPAQSVGRTRDRNGNPDVEVYACAIPCKPMQGDKR